jgi:hypothetical protein
VDVLVVIVAPRQQADVTGGELIGKGTLTRDQSTCRSILTKRLELLAIVNIQSSGCQ